MAMIRVDLEADKLGALPPGNARLLALGEGAVPIQAEYFDTMRTMDAATQGRAFLFLALPNRPKLLPGMALSAWVTTEGKSRSGVILQRSAVVRYNGGAWVYVQTSDTTFSRTEIALDCPVEQGWFVADGLKSDSKVVTVGSQQLLSEELKGQGGED